MLFFIRLDFLSQSLFSLHFKWFNGLIYSTKQKGEERMDKQTELARIQQEFTDLADLLAAIGDETRQYLIQAMFELPCKQEGGARVGAITEKTHLSRPAVSHHIKILKDAGVVGMRKEGTKNYYYLETDNRRWQELAQLSQHLVDVIDYLNEVKSK